MRLESLMLLAEASNGYTGGACTDQHPTMTLAECIHELPIAILECQNDQYDMIEKNNDMMVEAAVNAITYGSSIDYDTLIEASIKDVGVAVKKFFTRIGDFLKSIIAKIKMAIDKKMMSAKKLLATYGDKTKGKDFSDCTVKGTKFVDGDMFTKAKTYESNPADLVKVAIGNSEGKYELPGAFISSNSLDKGISKETAESLSKVINGMKRVDKKQRLFNAVKALTDSSRIHPDTWKKDLAAEYYSDTDHLFEYGKDGFTYEEVVRQIQNPADLKAIEAEYENIRNAVNHVKDNMMSTLDSYEQKDTGSDEKLKSATSVVISYIKAYLEVFQEVMTAITSVKTFKYNYAVAKENQIKKFYGVLMSYNKKKTDDKKGVNENAVYFDLFDM